MKKLLRLKTMLLLCALIAGSGSVWADNTITIDFEGNAIPTGWTNNNMAVVANPVSNTSSTNGSYVLSTNGKTSSSLTSGEFSNVKSISVDATKTSTNTNTSLYIDFCPNSSFGNSDTQTQQITTINRNSWSTTTLTLTSIATGYVRIRWAGTTAVKFIDNIVITCGSTTYSVTYDGNGNTSGAVPADNNQYEASASVTVLGNTGNLAKTGYTFGGWNTKDDGTGTSYVADETFTISANTTLYAKWNASSVSAPSIDKASGEYDYNTAVTITTTEEDIFYTTDGTDPSTSGTAIDANGQSATVYITKDMTLTAISLDGELNASAPVIREYTVTKPAAPIFSPVAGSYVGSQTVTISSPAGTTISYTTDGTDPSTSGTATLTDDNSASVNVTTTTTIRAITIDANAIESVETTASYTIVTPKTMPYSETFASSLNDFTVVADATLGDLWAINSSSAKASAYKNSAQNAGESWLVSPYITIAANAELSFEHADQYFNSENEMKSEATLWIREAGGDWQSLPINTYPEYTAKTKSDFASNATDLSAFAGKNVQIGFKYLGNTKSAGSWYVKNFKIEAVNPAPTFTLSSTAETLEMGSKETVDITLTTNTDGEISAASDDTDVATVALKSAGVYTITAKMEGTATITISAPETANFKAASQTVSVTVEDNREDAGIAFAEATQETTLGADYAGQALTNGNGVSPIAWTSTDETVATVSNGVVTVKAAGETTIKATYAGSATYKAAVAEYTLTVNKKAAAIEYAVSEATAKIGKAFAAPALANPNDLDVVYASSDESVATISSDGDVTIVAAGTTTISATFTEDAEYSGAVAQYTLTVVDPTNLTATFDFVNNNYGMEELSGSTQSYNSDPCEVSEGIVTMTLTGNTRCWITSSNPKTLELRFYKSSTFSVSVPDGYVITKIQLTGAESSNVSTEVGSYNNTVWTGSSQSVTFTSTHTSGNKALTAAVVSYKKTQEGVTIGDSKYATFCSDYALDFSGSDVKAYKAKVSENKVVLTRIENDIVPAGTGVILYCETADDYSIPVTTTEATVIDNELVGVTERTLVDWTTDGKYNYILQSGQFNNANGGYLKANRAYLHTNYNVNGAGARALEIVFDDETTGITSTAMQPSTEQYYDLQGRRVAQPTKGLYIVNGRKVVIK